MYSKDGVKQDIRRPVPDYTLYNLRFYYVKLKFLFHLLTNWLSKTNIKMFIMALKTF